MVPIRDIAALTGLDLDQLIAVDRMPIASALPTARAGSTWRQLHSADDLDLDFDVDEDGEPGHGEAAASPPRVLIADLQATGRGS